MLDLVWIGAVALVSPYFLAVFSRLEESSAADVGHQLGSVSVFGNAVDTTALVAALALDLGSVGVSELDHVVIVNFAVVDPGANLTAAHPHRGDRMAFHDPIGHVQVVNMLLDDVIAAQPHEVIPVAHLVFHFGLVRLARANPHAGVVPIDAEKAKVAKLPILNPLDGFDVVGLMMALKSDADLEVLFLGFLDGGQEFANALGIGRHRLFRKDVLALLDGVLEMNRPKSRRRRDDDQVGAGVDRLLIGVEADKLMIVLDIDLVAVLALERVVRTLEAIFKRVGHRDQFDRPLRGAQRLPGGAASATAAADERDLDRLIAGGMSRPRDKAIGGGYRGGGGRRGLYKIATGGRSRFDHWEVPREGVLGDSSK